MSTPTEKFLEGHDAYPFGGAETRIPGTHEWRGWWTMHREAVRKHRPRSGPYRPRLSGSDAAINTVLRCL